MFTFFYAKKLSLIMCVESLNFNKQTNSKLYNMTNISGLEVWTVTLNLRTIYWRRDKNTTHYELPPVTLHHYCMKLCSTCCRPSPTRRDRTSCTAKYAGHTTRLQRRNHFLWHWNFISWSLNESNSSGLTCSLGIHTNGPDFSCENRGEFAQLLWSTACSIFRQMAK